jgi:hypothetical protein
VGGSDPPFEVVVAELGKSGADGIEIGMRDAMARC